LTTVAGRLRITSPFSALLISHRLPGGLFPAVFVEFASWWDRLGIRPALEQDGSTIRPGPHKVPTQVKAWWMDLSGGLFPDDDLTYSLKSPGPRSRYREETIPVLLV
jgi:hypothetical protein